MALQASGPISFSDIVNEFGSPPTTRLGAYRISQTIGDLTLPLDAGIPVSGSIRFGNFYSKRLNIVVNCGAGSRIVARNRYNSDLSVTVIGGFKSKPESSSGSKVWIYSNSTIGSNIPASSAPNRQYCSLITGGWDADTDLRLDIGGSGLISGAGGDGGRGGSDRCGSGNGGRFGTSAIGVDYQPITITNRGRIQGGSGGGGSGGAAYGENRRSSRRDVICRAAGGGGGGGMGVPGGAGGGPGGGTSATRATLVRNPTGGGTGGSTFQGGGGIGGLVSGAGASATGGTGGSGGNNGGGGSGSSCSPPGGPAGAAGFGIIVTNDGTGVSISGNAIINGVAYNTAVV